MQTLTIRQKQILEYLRDYQAEHGYPPSFRETAGYFKINLGTVQDHLKALTRKGYLSREVNRSRGLRLIPSPGPLRTVPLYGAIPAGDPRQIEESAEGLCFPSGKLGQGSRGLSPAGTGRKHEPLYFDRGSGHRPPSGPALSGGRRGFPNRRGNHLEAVLSRKR